MRFSFLKGDEKEDNKIENSYTKWRSKMRELFYDYDHIDDEPSFYMATQGRDREEQFIVKDRAISFSSAQRSLIVMQILLRAKFDDTDKVSEF